MAAKRPASPTRVGCHSHNLRHKRNLTPIVSSAKQHRDPCSGPSTDSKELREVRFGFPFNQIGQSNNGFFNTQANHGAYSNPGTQLGNGTRILELAGRRT